MTRQRTSDETSPLSKGKESLNLKTVYKHQQSASVLQIACSLVEPECSLLDDISLLKCAGISHEGIRLGYSRVGPIAGYTILTLFSLMIEANTYR